MLNELKLLGQGLAAWTGVHYAAVYGYQWLCVPGTWWEVVMAPLTMAAPHCRGLVWVIDASSMSVVGIWAATGLLLSGQIVALMPRVLSSAASPVDTHDVGPE